MSLWAAPPKSVELVERPCRWTVDGDRVTDHPRKAITFATRPIRISSR